MDLNICTHTFGGAAVTVVMEAFRKYYLLVEKEALKLQTEHENEEISEEEHSREEQSRSVKHLSLPQQMDNYKTTCTSRTSTMSKTTATKSQGTKHTMMTQKSKDRDTMSKKTQQKRKLIDELTFSSSSDEGILKKKTKEAERIPNTHTTLGLSPSQEEGVLNANRCGRRSLSLKNQRKAEDLLEEEWRRSH